MPRRKLSEYRSKRLVYDALGLGYVGWGINSSDRAQGLGKISGYERYVVKVDQAVKGRFKKDLVTLDVTQNKIKSVIEKYEHQGYSHFIVEPHISHKDDDERYLSITLSANDLTLSTSRSGGVDIEKQADSIVSYRLDKNAKWGDIVERTGLSRSQIESLISVFTENHFVFLEINPYIVKDDGAVNVLDAAVEVDDAAAFLTSGWSESDIRHAKNLTSHESIVRALDDGSVASFNLSVINPQGSIFLLLSGGGASIVVADEIYNQGFGEELANYGEYSGNPSLHETVKYTSQILELLTASKAPKKILFIGGAVANFTDIAVTFAGVIEAIDAYASKLKKHNVKVYVRRGGPNQDEGLKNIQIALERQGILGAVHDAGMPITVALDEALGGLKR